MPPRFTNLLLCSKPVQRNWLHFFKKFKKQCALKGLMKLKLLRQTPLLTIVFHYKVRKNQEKIKGPSFGSTRRFLTWLLTYSQ